MNRKTLKPMLRYAKEHGYHVQQTRSGHLRFSKPGRPVVFAPATPSDFRSVKNALSKLRRAENTTVTFPGDRRC